MSKWRKKPVVVEAVQWNGHNAEEVLEFTRTAEGPRLKRGVVVADGLYIATEEGTMRAEIGDWIIRGVKGEVYPVVGHFE